ncbi:hypothetical protein CFK37_11785 [Virgibacillus phasianinus]|uniref:DUF4309 domain-containing protein n=1 Tax=Virgibacillus phasianinus TaxID=2017483 RepID=A0A220U4D0_9BACI|nr:YjgB family protein [Virgibacillus phasianinus]ASK62776.1 hypothetical protein CFK37_11785 [Virgibacillus phasianinus]
MIKKVGIIIVLMAAAVLISWFFAADDTGTKQDKNNMPSTRSPNIEDKGFQPGEGNTEEIIDHIFTLAKRGRIPQTSIIAGKTTIDEIHKRWGEPDDSTQIPRGRYDTYSEHHITVGYLDGLIFDVRSSALNLQDIHLSKLKEVRGEPDDTRYYKDETHDQIILVYKVSENYQLKWILTDEGDNPKVDHISVFKTLTD